METASRLQAPLTNTDTAMLSGSLSTHNGSGGGNINVTLRRVTSAKGWGEVHTTNANNNNKTLELSKHGVYLHFCSSSKVEFGAGDTLGPLVGLKVFRNITARW